MRRKNLGFTLAEVLIVIGIIGVVAALTLPNLNNATGDKEKITKVKKIYSALTEAFDRAQATYGPCDTWSNELSTPEEKSERFAKRVTEFMKISKDCGFDDCCFSTGPQLGFIPTEWEDEDGLHTQNFREENYCEALKDCSSYMVTLSDGMSLAFRCDGDVYKIHVDIDGASKGQNKIGSDLFDFTVLNENYDYNLRNQLFPSHPKYREADYSDFYSTQTGGNTTVWVIENGNLDYLKCPDELNWQTKTSCD